MAAIATFADPGFPPVHGPKRFFFYSVYESDRTGAPIAFLNRSLGSIDSYAAAIGRWLVTRDGFDLLVHYLPDYDYASHAVGPDAAHEALARADDSIAALLDAAGGPDEFLDRYAVVLCSDHGQSLVKETARLEVPGGLVTASNRAGMVYGENPRRLAEALDGESAVDVALFLEDGEVVARSGGADDPRILDRYPNGRARAEAALRNRNAGEVILSAAAGYEFADLGGRHHAGGGSHGSLAVRRLRGADADGRHGPPPDSITGIKGLILEHFGVTDRAAQERSRRLTAMTSPPAWIDRQLARRGIHDARVLAAMERVPRELFVPEDLRRRPTTMRPSRCHTGRRSPSPTWSR